MIKELSGLRQNNNANTGVENFEDSAQQEECLERDKVTLIQENQVLKHNLEKVNKNILILKESLQESD